MKFEINRVGGIKIMNNDGGEIRGVSSITIHAEVGMDPTAQVELSFIETTYLECEVREFSVGVYSGVVALILANGETVNLTKELNGST